MKITQMGVAGASIADGIIARLQAENDTLRETCRNIVALASGWDEDGAIGPRPPLSWETVARMAMDYARAALASSTTPASAPGAE